MKTPILASVAVLASAAIFAVTAQRKVGYYLWKVLLPLLFIVALSWSVFWMGNDSFDGQMGVTITCVLALIAFNFVIGDELPKISYLTALDWMILLAYAFVFLSAIENLIAVQLARGGKTARAERLDRMCRWGFPVAYVTTTALLLVAKL